MLTFDIEKEHMEQPMHPVIPCHEESVQEAGKGACRCIFCTVGSANGYFFRAIGRNDWCEESHVTS